MRFQNYDVMSVGVIVHVVSIGSQRTHYGMSQLITIYNFICVNKTSLLKPVRYNSIIPDVTIPPGDTGFKKSMTDVSYMYLHI